MARSRLIKPALAKNEVLAELGPHAQLLFALLPCFADRDGRLEDRPRRLKAEIFPYYEVDVDSMLDSLAGCSEKFITRFEVNGKRYIQITNFSSHQSPHHKESASTIPAQVILGSSKDQASPKHDNLETHAPNRVKVTSNKDKEEETSNKDEIVVLESDIATDDLTTAVIDWLRYKAERREGYKPTGQKQFISRVSNLAREHGPPYVIDMLRRAMASGWKGFDHAPSQNGKSAINEYDRDAVLSEADRKLNEALNGTH